MALRRWVGASVKRKEDPKLIAGMGTYVDDITLPRMVYASYVRSPYAHARIKRIDVSAARRQRGVVLVMTGEDVKAMVNKSTPCVVTEPSPGKILREAKLRAPPHNALAVDKVRYAGEPVAVVLAEDRYVVRDASELVEVEYEPLPAVVDAEKAAAKGASLLYEELGTNIAYYQKSINGDVEHAFREADKVVKERLVIQRLAPNPMETRGIFASYDIMSQSLTVYMGTQAPHVMRTRFSEYLGLPENKIRVVAPDVGGGFGCKAEFYSDEVVACLASMKLGRPVKWIEERRESLMATTHGRDQVHYVELAVKKDGKIIGLRDKFYADYGAFLGLLTPATSHLTVAMITGNYDIRNVEVELIGVFTNKMSLDAYRGAGRPEATYVIERMVDAVARALDIDPPEVRRRNFVTKDKFPYKNAMDTEYDSGDYHKALGKALAIVGYEKLRKEQGELRKKGKLMGIGMATYVEICGFGPSKDMPERWGGYESALVRLDPGGKVTVYTGTSSHGQGHETPFAQIVADELGVSIDDIIVVHGDTASIPYGMGTYGSRSAFVGGHAVLKACEKVREKALRISSHLLEARVEDIEFKDGKFYVKGFPQKAYSIAEIAAEANFMKKLPKDFEPGLEATSFYEPPSTTFPFGTHIAVVDVDADTGSISIRKYVAVDDCGKVINPMIVDGQIHGGVAQGLGQALYEELVFDENGQMLTSTLMDYLIPSSMEVPNMVLERTETPSLTPLGVKGIGEAGTIVSTAALVNAVADALAHLGARVTTTPMKPENIWRLVQQKA